MEGSQDAEKAPSQNILPVIPPLPLPEEEDPFHVKFTTPPDPSNPKDWSLLKKWTVTSVLSFTGFNRIMVSTIMAPALPIIAAELHMSNTEAVMSMSVYLLATAFGPLVIGPLSEIYGRRPVLHATSVWFLIWNIVCGFAETKGTLIAARLLAGFGASAIYALGGGVLGDVWRPEERGRSLGLYMLIPLLGVSAGPILGGFITENTTWRWMFWSTSILQVFMIAVSLPFFHETYAPTILRKRARHLRLSTGDPRYYTTIERHDVGRSVSWTLTRNLTRPLRLLLFHPIIQVQAVLSAFNYGVLYLVLSTFSSLYTGQYHESISISGLHYISPCLSELLGAEIGGPLMDYTYKKLQQRYNGVAVPEFRVPVMLPGAILAPIGLLLYGWAAQKQLHWIVVDIGAAILCFGMQIGGQGAQAYVIDTYPDHASSASAAAQFLRSLTAFGFPLFAPTMYKVLGYGWGNSLVGICAVVLGIPAPWLLWIYGSKLRARAVDSY